jgi:hypothetical protein
MAERRVKRAGGILAALMLFASACSPTLASQPSTPAVCHYQGELPDQDCTPGAVDPAVTQDNLQQTICQAGYTRRVRPSVEYTNRVKDERLRAYGQDPANRGRYELDHLIPLELGGAPADVLNLWPESEPGYHNKDHVENELHAAVCSGHMLLTDAQQRMAHDWTTALAGAGT